MREETNALSNWSLDNIPLDSIDHALVENREDLFYLVVAASFVEIASDLYTDNLAKYFEGDHEVVDWLVNRWQVEEIRHGRSLRAYARHAWPDFDWESAYSGFFAEYSHLCTLDQFEPTRGLEMVARCVVETGTATLYQTLAQQTEEPVLAGIATRIRADEINHYKHFYRYFRKYNAINPAGRLRIFSAIRRRLFEARQDDAVCALWHAYLIRNPAANAGKPQFRALCTQLGRQVRQHYPITMAARMLLKPLSLPAGLARTVEGPVAKLTALVLRH
ncbi:MAG: ferritin-like domain-containing protein [Hydrogenophilales bacterium]|nr:ferritin-like domain-containing protein [Hydrogenophilales bacterium]